MMKLQRWRARYILVLVTIAVATLFVLLPRPGSSPLVVMSFDKKFGVSTLCTFGTNHVYYYGDSLDRVFDPAFRRWKLVETNAYRLRYQSDHPATVVWVRFDHPDYAKQPPLVATPAGPVRLPAGGQPHFRARLINKAGAETVLDQVGSMQHYKRGFYVEGWLLRGSLEDHRDDLLLIDSTNNMEVVTFRVP